MPATAPRTAKGKRRAEDPQKLVVAQPRRARVQGWHDMDPIGQQPATAERDPAEIAAPHCPQTGDELAPEQY
ncbi:hypothetical protein NKJ40_29605 [Mesorhizobium sp. M0119]|uniref:hypothetical protein n=1 Tax=unclassified Mesorhizobium TaxID=325217 RepID=UPI00333D27EB